MGNNRRIGKKLKSEIERYFNQQIAEVKIPQAPQQNYHDYCLNLKDEEIPDTFPMRHRTGFYVLRTAFAVILIICGAASFSLPKRQNYTAKIITNIFEKENLEIKVTSGLQKAGWFLYTNL